LHWGKKFWGKMHLFRGSLHSCIWELFFAWVFSRALLPMVSSPFASPWGVGNFGAFYLGCVEPLPLPYATEISLTQVIFSWLLFAFWSLSWVFLSFFSFSFFSELVTSVCCQCTHQGGDWGLERPRTSGWSLLAVMSDWQHGVD
jgi:hypothetical protein